jgi:hypothetical protein
MGFRHLPAGYRDHLSAAAFAGRCAFDDTWQIVVKVKVKGQVVLVHRYVTCITIIDIIILNIHPNNAYITWQIEQLYLRIVDDHVPWDAR